MATEIVQGRRYKTIIECKNWTRPVSQNVVHAFRTIVADCGANVGYVVSKAGFQAGAHNAAMSTNIKLVSWEQFQEAFQEQWYWTHLVERVRKTLDPLCSYLEPIPAMVHWDKYLDAPDVERLKAMFHQHQPLGALIMLLHPEMKRIRSGIMLPLPLGQRVEDYGALPESLTRQSGYREFFDELVTHSLPILREFQSFREKAMGRKNASSPPSASSEG